MAQRRPVTLTLELAEFDRETRRFLGTLLPAQVDLAVRKIAFDVVQRTMRYLNGLRGLPKRIDTGRLRGGWRVALANGGLPTTGLPSTVPENTAGDGSATFTGRGLNVTVTVQNRVDYAPHVEHGTRHMAPGKHLETALRTTRRGFPRGPGGDFRKGVQRAFEEGR